eukprot:SAG31_NODE_3615_length_4066_cov_3.735316_3_plen_229_part_00
MQLIVDASDVPVMSFRRKAEQLRANHPTISVASGASARWPENVFLAIKKRRGIDPRELCAYIRGGPPPLHAALPMPLNLHESATAQVAAQYSDRLPAPKTASTRRRRTFKIAAPAAATPPAPVPSPTCSAPGSGFLSRYFTVVASAPVETTPGEIRAESGQVFGSRSSKLLQPGRYPPSSGASDATPARQWCCRHHRNARLLTHLDISIYIVRRHIFLYAKYINIFSP